MLWMKMKAAVYLVAAVLLVGGGAAIAVKTAVGAPAAASGEAEPGLQGTWLGTEVGGPEGECRLTVSGQAIKFQGARPEEWYEARLTFKTNASPKQATALIEKCPFPRYVNKTASFIYKLEQKTLTLAGTEPGSDKMPASFDRSPDNPVRVFILKKQ